MSEYFPGQGHLKTFFVEEIDLIKRFHSLDNRLALPIDNKLLNTRLKITCYCKDHKVYLDV